MQRRKFLGTIALGAGATTLPVWLSAAFFPDDSESCPEPGTDPPIDPATPPRDTTPGRTGAPDRCAPGSAPYDKPQLVFVIPTDKALMYPRGQAFGELLNHGSDEQLAALACFEVVCRRVADLGVAVDGEPLMLVIDPSAAIPVRPLDAPLPQNLELHERFGQEDWDERQRREEEIIDRRISTLADLISAAAHERLDEQACRERAGLPPREFNRLADLPAGLGELQPADVDRAPATATLAARGGDPEQRTHLTALMAAAVRTRLCNGPIGETRWARSGGCGTVVEGEESRGGFACGMGHVPARSARFLKFYTDDRF